METPREFADKIWGTEGMCENDLKEFTIPLSTAIGMIETYCRKKDDVLTKINPTVKSIKYGQLLDWQESEGVVATSVKVHFFNKKGVLIGRYYKFVPYSELIIHPSGLIWECSRIKKPFGRFKQWFYELKCRIITALIKSTQDI